MRQWSPDEKAAFYAADQSITNNVYTTVNSTPELKSSVAARILAVPALANVNLANQDSIEASLTDADRTAINLSNNISTAQTKLAAATVIYQGAATAVQLQSQGYSNAADRVTYENLGVDGVGAAKAAAVYLPTAITQLNQAQQAYNTAWTNFENQTGISHEQAVAYSTQSVNGANSTQAASQAAPSNPTAANATATTTPATDTSSNTSQGQPSQNAANWQNQTPNGMILDSNKPVFTDNSQPSQNAANWQNQTPNGMILDSNKPVFTDNSQGSQNAATGQGQPSGGLNGTSITSGVPGQTSQTSTDSTIYSKSSLRDVLPASDSGAAPFIDALNKWTAAQMNQYASQNANQSPQISSPQSDSRAFLKDDSMIRGGVNDGSVESVPLPNNSTAPVQSAAQNATPAASSNSIPASDTTASTTPSNPTSTDANDSSADGTGITEKAAASTAQAMADAVQAAEAGVKVTTAPYGTNSVPDVALAKQVKDAISDAAQEAAKILNSSGSDSAPMTSDQIEAVASEYDVTSGDVLEVANLEAIYKGYSINQPRSTVIQVTSSQVNHPTDVMTVPSTQVQTPSPMINMPSMQVNVPSSQINVPSMQVQAPSDLIDMPSLQIDFPSELIDMPSDAMTSLDLQPALCGH
jgi:hypothetical protein